MLLPPRQQVYLGVFLAVLMVATRTHHFSGLHHLPDASWAILFLAGVYLRPIWAGLAFAGLGALIDWVAIEWAGVASFCVTPAYAMLWLAYATLWLGGRWMGRHYRARWSNVLSLVLVVGVSSFVAELWSSGGFYFLGGRFEHPTLAGFLPRLMLYFPPMLSAMALYIALAAVGQAIVSALKDTGPRALFR